MIAAFTGPTPPVGAALDVATAAAADAETGVDVGVDVGVAQTKRKRKRRRTPGGLGRGLARILTETQAPSKVVQPSRSGLLQLVGGHSNAKTDRIRRFVVDTALSTMVDGFGLDGVVLAAQGPDAEPPGDEAVSQGQQLSLLPPPRGSDPGSDPGPGSDTDSRSIDSGSCTGSGFDSPGPTDVDLGGPEDLDPGADNGGGAPTFLAARLPPSWAAESQILFEVYGNLWNALQRQRPAEGASAGSEKQRPVEPTPVVQRSVGPAAGAQEQWQVPIGRHWVLVSRMDDDGLPVGAAAVRKAPFTPEEAEALGTVIGSVVAACSDSDEKAAARHEIRNGTKATVKSLGALPGPSAAASGGKSADATAAADGTPSAPVELLAEVDAHWELRSVNGDGPVGVSGRRRGVGRGSDPVVAVARAAAKACRPRCEIAFAGASELEDVVVSIVMIRHARHGLRLGYAVRPRGDHSGAAEAVFTAAG